MRKNCLLLVLLLLFVSILYTHGMAEEVQPLAVDGARVEAIVSFTNGQVNAIGTAHNVPTEMRATLLIFLQRQSGDSWITIANNADVGRVCASETAVAENTYRAYVICRFIDSTGSCVETQHCFSAPRTY